MNRHSWSACMIILGSCATGGGGTRPSAAAAPIVAALPDWNENQEPYLFTARVTAREHSAHRVSVVFRRRLPPGQAAPPHQLQAHHDARDPGWFVADATGFGPFFSTEIVDFHWRIEESLAGGEERVAAVSAAQSFQIGGGGFDRAAQLAREQAGVLAAFGGLTRTEELADFGYEPLYGTTCWRGLGVVFRRVDWEAGHRPALGTPDLLYFAPRGGSRDAALALAGWGYAAAAAAARPQVGLLPYHEWMLQDGTWTIRLWVEPGGPPRLGMWHAAIDGVPMPEGSCVYPPGRP